MSPDQKQMTRTVFITGVSSGIGLGLAQACLQHGFEVYGISRREPPKLADHPSFHFKPLDLEKFDQIEIGMRDLLRPIESLHLVILNAGILGKLADLRDTPLAQMQHVMKLNVWANKIIIDALYTLRIPVQQVVAISSGAATSPHRGWNAYCISKASLNMLTALYAAERPETHFSAIAPGVVDTPMQDLIARMPQDNRFPTLESLRQAKGTPLMPSAREAADRLMEGFEKAVKYPSGSFLDLNTLVKRNRI